VVLLGPQWIGQDYAPENRQWPGAGVRGRDPLPKAATPGNGIPSRCGGGMGYVIQDAGLFPHWTVEANIGSYRGSKNGSRLA